MICNLNHCGEEAQIEDSANIEQGGGDSLISQFLSTDLISQMIPNAPQYFVWRKQHMEVMVAPPKGNMISDQYDFRCIFHDPLISVIGYAMIIIAERLH